jgi:hypothetical protein
MRRANCDMKLGSAVVMTRGFFAVPTEVSAAALAAAAPSAAGSGKLEGDPPPGEPPAPPEAPLCSMK